MCVVSTHRRSDTSLGLLGALVAAGSRRPAGRQAVEIDSRHAVGATIRQQVTDRLLSSSLIAATGTSRRYEALPPRCRFARTDQAAPNRVPELIRGPRYRLLDAPGNRRWDLPGHDTAGS